MESAVLEEVDLDEAGLEGLLGASQLYKQSIPRFKLTPEEEEALAKWVEAGLYAQHLLEQGELPSGMDRDELEVVVAEGWAAKDRLIEACLFNVWCFAWRYTGQGMSHLELVQEGNLGLIRAVEKFNYVKGFRISTYVPAWIRQTIERALADQSRTIRIPRYMVQLINRVKRAHCALRTSLGHDPSLTELAEALGLSEDEVLKLLAYDCEPLSFDQPLPDGDRKPIHGGGVTIGDMVAQAVQPAAESPDRVSSLVLELRAAIGNLSQREQALLRLAFGLDGLQYAPEELAREFGTSRKCASNVLKRILRKLREVLEERGAAYAR